MIQRLDHVDLDHIRQGVVRGHDDVVARIAGLEFCKQLFIAGEQVVLDLDAALFFEGVERRLADISVPVIDVELLLFGREPAARQDRDRHAGGAGSPQPSQQRAP
jgi:hypothetical protein